MQQALGKTFTAKFEGMWKDMTTSEELTRDYQQYVRNLGGDARPPEEGPDAAAAAAAPAGRRPRHQRPDEQLLAASRSWAAPPTLDGAGVGSKGHVPVPPEIARLQRSFLKYYLKDRSGRILHWVGSGRQRRHQVPLPPRPTATTRGRWARERKYELNVPTYGMGRLDALQRRARRLLALHRGHPGPDQHPARRAHPRPGLAVPAAQVPRPAQGAGFQDHQARRQVLLQRRLRQQGPEDQGARHQFISKIEAEEERKATEEKNNQTRSHVVDAAIVRIMK